MRAIDWLQLCVLAVLWGCTFLFVAVALRDLPPMTLVMLRCAIATLTLAPLLYVLNLSVSRSRPDWRDFAVMSLLNNVIPFTLIFYGQKSIPSGLASVLNATTPLMSLLVLRYVAGEPWTTNKLVGIVIGIVGVATLVGPDLGNGSSGSALGMFVILLATLAYGFSGLWGRRLKSHPAVVTAFSQMIVSTVVMAACAAAVDRFWTLPLPSYPAILATIALGVMSTALAYILFFRIMASAGPLNVMLVTLLIPIVSVSLGHVFLAERLSALQIAGAALIGFSLLVIDGRLLRWRSAARQ